MRLHAWILLGGQNARKGSTIRALTGMYRASMHPFDVRLLNGQNLSLHPKSMSINEDPNSGDPLNWIAQFNSSYRYNLLMALQLRYAEHGYNDVDYVNALVSSDAKIESIITLGEASPQWVKDLGVPYAHVLDNTVPTNAIVEQVKQLWGWL